MSPRRIAYFPLPAATLTAGNPILYYPPGDPAAGNARGWDLAGPLSVAAPETLQGFQKIPGPYLTIWIRSNAALDQWCHIGLEESHDGATWVPVASCYTPQDRPDFVQEWRIRARFARALFRRPSAASLAGDPQILQGHVLFSSEGCCESPEDPHARDTTFAAVGAGASADDTVVYDAGPVPADPTTDPVYLSKPAGDLLVPVRGEPLHFHARGVGGGNISAIIQGTGDLAVAATSTVNLTPGATGAGNLASLVVAAGVGLPGSEYRPVDRFQRLRVTNQAGAPQDIRLRVRALPVAARGKRG